ncbi:MAG: hypothetical protein ACI4HN_08590 [Ruminococcus sp.]
MKNKGFSIFTILIAISLLFTGCTQTENNKTETTAIQETSVANTTATSNTVATIKTTEPVKPSKQEVIKVLEAHGLDDSYIRKTYVFDDANLNSTNNKNYVLDRMCNSIDYFTTLQASYTKKVNNKITWVTYAIDRRTDKAKELVYSVSESDKKCTPTNYNYVDGDYHYKMNFGEEAKSKYTVDFVPPLDSDDNNAIDKLKEFINKPLSNELDKVTAQPNLNSGAFDNDDYEKYIDITKKVLIYDGSPVISFQRSDTVNLITAREHYFPPFFALDTLYNNNNYNKWYIEKPETQDSTKIICIKGTYEQYGDENLKRSYTLRIDKNTGVINSLQICNNSGNVVEEWNTLRYVVDGEIDENIFDSIKIKNRPDKSVDKINIFMYNNTCV